MGMGPWRLTAPPKSAEGCGFHPGAEPPAKAEADGNADGRGQQARSLPEAQALRAWGDLRLGLWRRRRGNLYSDVSIAALAIVAMEKRGHSPPFNGRRIPGGRSPTGGGGTLHHGADKGLHVGHDLGECWNYEVSGLDIA